jgi:hypothetical protein
VRGWAGNRELKNFRPAHPNFIYLLVLLMPPAARNLFIKRFLDFQKFFIKMIPIELFETIPYSAFQYIPTLPLRGVTARLIGSPRRGVISI